LTRLKLLLISYKKRSPQWTRIGLDRIKSVVFLARLE
jgi:hypothetical protein